MSRWLHKLQAKAAEEKQSSKKAQENKNNTDKCITYQQIIEATGLESRFVWELFGKQDKSDYDSELNRKVATEKLEEFNVWCNALAVAPEPKLEDTQEIPPVPAPSPEPKTKPIAATPPLPPSKPPRNNRTLDPDMVSLQILADESGFLPRELTELLYLPANTARNTFVSRTLCVQKIEELRAYSLDCRAELQQRETEQARARQRLAEQLARDEAARAQIRESSEDSFERWCAEVLEHSGRANDPILLDQLAILQSYRELGYPELLTS